MVDFGCRLKNLRNQAGLTQKELAARLGVTKSVVSYYELQERYPSPEILVKLSVVFHVSTDYLLGIHDRQTLDVTGLSDEDISALAKIVASLKK